MQESLWNKNFTIITVGSIISMLGNAVSSFALAVLILELTDSSFAFAFYLALNNVPRLIVPIIAGTLLDRFSRVKVIYVLDFISAFIYLFIFFGIIYHFMTYQIFLVLAVVIGTIDSIYSVAYDSLYPTFISKGNFSKAYSISSMIYPIAAFMTPVAAFVHESIGLQYLFIFNSLSFFVAALFETRMSSDEAHLHTDNKRYNVHEFANEYKQGFKYLYSEKGLLAIALFFFSNSLFQSSPAQTLPITYFRATPSLGYQRYTFISTANVLGRFIGGFLHYRFTLPKDKKFAITMSVYVIICFTSGLYLYFPFAIMLLLNFLTGILSVTSYNIRLSSTQSYIPNNMRGRFNGAFLTITTTGLILGQLLFGILGEIFSTPNIMMWANVVTLILTFVLIYRNRKHVAPIYNQSI